MTFRTIRRAASLSPRRRTYLIEAALLAVLASTAVFLWTAPLRSERFLRVADTPQLDEAARREPNNPRVFYYKGLSLQRTGRTDLAHDAFGRAALLNADDERSWLAWAATAREERGEAEALGILETFRQRHPDSVPIHLALARSYQEAHMSLRAYNAALSAARLEPGSAPAWRLAGTAACVLRHYPDAEAALRRASAIDPGDWHDYHGLGDALMEQHHTAEAIPYFRRAVALAPRQFLPRVSLARALIDTAQGASDFDEARRHLGAAIALVPDLPPALLLLGRSYTRQGRWVEARQLLERAERLAPNDAAVHFELSRLYQNIGLEPEARREVRLHALALRYSADKQRLMDRIQDQPDADAYLTLARLLAAHGDREEAISLYRKIVAHGVGRPYTPEQQPAERELSQLERPAASPAAGQK
jgi:tetratricopeptide (TPR) repeat protein